WSSWAIALGAHAERRLREAPCQAGTRNGLQHDIALRGRLERAWLELDAQSLITELQRAHRFRLLGQRLGERRRQRQELAHIGFPRSDTQIADGALHLPERIEHNRNRWQRLAQRSRHAGAQSALLATQSPGIDVEADDPNQRTKRGQRYGHSPVVPSDQAWRELVLQKLEGREGCLCCNGRGPDRQAQL